MNATEVHELLDWRRRISELYGRIRQAGDPRVGWGEWRTVKDRLFKEHPQSPLRNEDKTGFPGLDYFDYDPRMRIKTAIEPAEPKRYEIGTSGGEPYSFDRIGRVHLDLPDGSASLEVYWLEGYAGGLFLPFRDETAGTETYGAGRYLLDTVKGADLGSEGDELILDFNFAYHPSCAYDPRWICPLAPPENRVDLTIRAGERLFSGPGGI